ncbi:MAG TPA: hypothetical protein VMD74_00955 [Candidatus Methylomirabilis sp.]|nr:hypothetical protein [Candidatus Methylomirabilis sp.]
MIKEISLILNYSPLVVVPAVWLWAIVAYWKKWNLWHLIWVMISFLLGLALIKSTLQYWVWNQSQLTRTLLHLPLPKTGLGWFAGLPVFTKLSPGYFLYYSWNHFWQAGLLSVVVAFVVYGFFAVVGKYKKDYFFSREGKLACAMVLVVGWPMAIFLVILTLLLALALAVGQWLYRRQATTDLFWPLVISSAICLIFSVQLTNWRFFLVGF